MNMYFKTNIDLIIFIFSRFRSILIALIGIILFPLLITLILYWFIKNDFNLIFSYSFGVYSLVITVILFDYIIVYKRKEAKIMNSDKNLSSLISALNFIDSLMLSDKNFTYKIWKKQFRSEEHTSELQSRFDVVCRLLLEEKKSQSD